MRQGGAIIIHYDPMIAKLIVWDHDRPAAVQRLQAALRDYEVGGVQTNLDLLRRVASHPAFAAADLDTGFLNRAPALLAPDAANIPTAALAAAAARILADWTASLYGQKPHSRWNSATAWRLNSAGYQDLMLRTPDGTDHTLRVSPHADGSFDLETDGHGTTVALFGDAVALDGARARAPVVRHDATVYAVLDGVTWPFELVDTLAPPATASADGDRLVAPMPGRIVSVDVAPGDAVPRGQVLLVLEAMKVQMRLTTPLDGTVATVNAEAGALLDDGAELVSFEAA